MLSIEYRRGYNAGLKAGMREAMKDSIARVVMNKDLIYAYGCMAIVLQDLNGWDRESIETLIEEIQKEWTRLLDDETVDGEMETMAEYVERKTGIQLVQRVADIVEEDL